MTPKCLVLSLFYLLLVTPFALNAKPVTLATSLSIPPYIIKENNSGVQYEIIKQALAFKGHSIRKMTYASYKRLSKIVQRRQVDAVVIPSSDLPGTYASDVVINYINHAITLRSENITIRTIPDLLMHPVLAFQNAKVFLSQPFKDMVEKHNDYQEVMHQIKQVNQLFKKRTKVLVMDKRIFQYFRKQSQIDTSAEVTYHDVFEKKPQRVYFIDRQIRDDFNAGLQHLKTSGKMAHILSTGLSEENQ